MNQASDAGIGRRITRYGTILAVSGILCKILLLFYTVYAVEILGQEQFGRIEYFAEMAIIFSVLVDFGLEQTITRAIARQRDKLKNLLHPLMVYRLTVTAIGAVVMGLFLAITAQPGHTPLLISATIVYFFFVTIMMLVRAFTRSFEWLAVEGVANIVDKVVHISLALVVLFTVANLPLIMLCYAAGALVSLVIYLVIIFRNIGWPVSPTHFGNTFEWQKTALPLGLSAACILLLHRQDTAMVNWIQGDIETGLYRAPYRFLEGLFLFPQVMAISAYPVFSKLYHDNQPFSSTAGDLLRGLLLISLPIAVGGLYVSDGLMLFLVPELGEAGGTIFQLLLWSLPFIYANFLLGTILNATDRQNQNLRASAIGLIFNASFNIPAIYYYGAYGASVVTVFSQAVYCFLMLYDLRRFNLFDEKWPFIAIILSCMIMITSLYLLSLSWLLTIPTGAIIYLISVIVLRGIHKKDINKMISVIRGKNIS